jgi:tRNA pseudouridine55 synthase
MNILETHIGKGPAIQHSQGAPLSGFLCIGKSAGITSFQVVHKTRVFLPGSKVGHAGTLDPLATGLLVLAVGKSTKKVTEVANLEKEYAFTVQLGVTSTTDDTDGTVSNAGEYSHITSEKILALLPFFTGVQLQMPPVYSAKKISGVRAYALARKGRKVELKEKEVVIHSLDLLTMDLPFLKFKMVCSKGTYVRSFARDIGERLGCGGVVCTLSRERIGPFTIANALSDAALSATAVREYLMSEESALSLVHKFREKKERNKECWS